MAQSQCPGSVKLNYHLVISTIILFNRNVQAKPTSPSVRPHVLASPPQDEDMREGRFNFAGYNMNQPLPTKDGAPVKNAAPAANPQQPAPKDVDTMRKKFVDRAKRIDTISRAAFPLAFLIFNVFYWITYKIIRHEDIHAK